MKTLFKNCYVVNVFLDQMLKENVLVEDDIIIGVGNYYNDLDADVVIDLNNKILCPGFIDGHVHIESSMLTPYEFSKVVIPHGTTTIIADPHEIANVCGNDGLNYMLKSSKNLPLDIFYVLPSCVPATKFDESGTILNALSLKPFYKNKKVIGLGEVMDFNGVINKDKDLINKINDAINYNLTVDGHAPLLSEKRLDEYINKGIASDHECSSLDEAISKISKGQIIMIREGSAAKNLKALINLFDEPYNHNAILACDDRHPYDLINEGHIDQIIKKAIKYKKDPLVAIRMASIQTAKYFNLKRIGAIAPGFYANMLILNDLNTIDIEDVYIKGKKVVDNKKLISYKECNVPLSIKQSVIKKFNMDDIKLSSLKVKNLNKKVRVMKVIPYQLLTQEVIMELDFSKNNGINLTNDILKIALFERHNHTNHHFVGYINGINLKSGAIASSVAHDSHNLTIIGTNDKDMQFAGNYLKEIGGGLVYVKNQKVIASLPLKIAGLMSNDNVYNVSLQNENLLKAVYENGVNKELSPFMLMSFLSLSVIPILKITTFGYVNVNKQEIVPLFVD